MLRKQEEKYRKENTETDANKMRICLAHIIALCIIIVPLFFNIFFFFAIPKESESTYSLLHPDEETLENLVKQSLTSFTGGIKHIKSEIENTKNSLSQFDEKILPKVESSSYMVNYAEEKLGASIVNVKAEPIEEPSISSMVGLQQITNPPINILRSSLEPGSCFAFKNSTAEVEIKLAKEVLVEIVEVHHIPRSQTPSKDTSSAPRNFCVYVRLKCCDVTSEHSQRATASMKIQEVEHFWESLSSQIESQFNNLDPLSRDDLRFCASFFQQIMEILNIRVCIEWQSMGNHKIRIS